MPDSTVHPYFNRFTERGFSHDEDAPFADEFSRLARHMQWPQHEKVYSQQLGIAQRLNSPNSRFGRLNTLVAYIPLTGPDFTYDPTIAFEDEFERLAMVGGLDVESEEYEKHYTDAKLLEFQLHRITDRTDISFFEVFVERHRFQPDDEARVDAQFQLLAKHMKWKPECFVRQWQELLAELANVATVAHDVANPASSTEHAAGVSVRKPTETIAAYENKSAEVGRRPPGVSVYFWSFRNSGFIPDATASFEKEFNRLCEHQGWPTNAKNEFKNGFMGDFRKRCKKGSGKGFRRAKGGDWRSGSKKHSKPGRAPKKSKKERCFQDIRRLQFQMAMESELELHFGLATRLRSWQTLYAELVVVPAPECMHKCKETLKEVQVHISLLINSKRKALQDPKLALCVPFGQLSCSRADTIEQEATNAELSGFIFASLETLSWYCHDYRDYYPLDKAKANGFLKVLLRVLVSQEELWELCEAGLLLDDGSVGPIEETVAQKVQAAKIEVGMEEASEV